jgi:ribosomal protein L37AE/L43A
MNYLGRGRISLKVHEPGEHICWECARDETYKFTSGIKECPICERMYFLGRYLNDFGGSENFDSFIKAHGIKEGDLLDDLHLTLPEALQRQTSLRVSQG